MRELSFVILTSIGEERICLRDAVDWDGIRVRYTHNARLFYSQGTFHRSNKRLTRFLLFGHSRFRTVVACNFPPPMVNHLDSPDKGFNLFLRDINAPHSHRQTLMQEWVTALSKSLLVFSFSFFFSEERN